MISQDFNNLDASRRVGFESLGITSKYRIFEDFRFRFPYRLKNQEFRIRFALVYFFDVTYDKFVIIFIPWSLQIRWHYLFNI